MDPHQPRELALLRHLNYFDKTHDAAFCYLCSDTNKQGKLKAAPKDTAFLSKGFTNWKDTTEGFRKHE